MPCSHSLVVVEVGDGRNVELDCDDHLQIPRRQRVPHRRLHKLQQAGVSLAFSSGQANGQSPVSDARQVRVVSSMLLGENLEHLLDAFRGPEVRVGETKRLLERMSKARMEPSSMPIIRVLTFQPRIATKSTAARLPLEMRLAQSARHG